jgi:hypothetical protein
VGFSGQGNISVDGYVEVDALILGCTFQIGTKAAIFLPDFLDLMINKSSTSVGRSFPFSSIDWTGFLRISLDQFFLKRVSLGHAGG